ncbi:NAD(+) diphosphatase [Opitutus terrae]|uniref:NAD(+) diphosphatase n=1 Tax=Opitutus terrae (strain DSM 11246 / JCM 15787 / PB90-1) TaxID=452637 RepID=B1ZNT3_OPITP|nr:NAD(+) diphosphatase [Opitutus terrae]ACB75453.1 NUDIX hydrolase [Opitutus terrae PB90-1]
MAFIYHHARQATPGPDEPCLVIEGKRLLVRAAAVASGPRSEDARLLPGYAALAGWPGAAVAPLQIGELDGRNCWMLGVENAELRAPAGCEWIETRALLGVFTPAQWHAVSCARHLYWWQSRHRFCGVCGTPTELATDEPARRCPRCGALFFPVVSPAVIVAITRGEELLLAHNRNFPAGMFSLLAGFVDPGETLEQAVVREVREEVGIEIGGLSYVESQPWAFPNSLMIGFRARRVGGEIVADGKEIEEAGWFRRSALPQIPQPGTVARRLIEAWLKE